MGGGKTNICPNTFEMGYEPNKVFPYWRLATLLEHVNKQKIKVNFKNIVLFFLLVKFCCSVGESDTVGEAKND